VESDATHTCALLVGLPAVRLLGVEETGGGRIVVHVELAGAPPACPACRARARVKDRDAVELVNLPCFGRPARVIWRKHRWQCPACSSGSWTGEEPAIAPPVRR
jgi:hypothetical protein